MLHIEFMKIDQPMDPDYDAVSVGFVGFADPYAMEGISILETGDGREFHMRAFSGEVAKFMSMYVAGMQTPVPSVYNMINDICEMNDLTLVKVKIYESGQALRANLYFKGRTEMVLRNYRASDALALATYLGVPILVRTTLLKKMDS